MNDETPALTSPPPAGESATAAGESATPAAPVPGPARSRSGGGATLFLGVLVLLAFAAIGWLWKEQGRSGVELRHELASRLGAGDEAARDARAAARQAQESIDNLQQRLARAEGELAETRGQQAAIEALYQSLARSREDQLLVEVGQAVHLAAQQMQLAGNVEAALTALRGADARLAQVDAAPLVALRKAIASDIQELASASRLDVSGTALRIEVLISAVDRMALAFMTPPPAQSASELPPEKPGFAGTAKRLGLELWAEVRSLVRVERLDRPDPVLLSPAQEVFLRENLRLRLLSARLALLARDGRSYRTDLEMVRAWLERYFDAESGSVRNALDEVTALAAMDLSSDELPDLHTTLGVLRTLQQRPGAKVEAAKPVAPKPAAAPASHTEGAGGEAAAPAPAAEH